MALFLNEVHGDMKTLSLAIFFFLLFAQSLPGFSQEVAPATHDSEKVKGEVYVFLFSECPISQKYIPILNELDKKHPEIKFTGIFTQWDDEASMKAFNEKYGVNFDTRRDAGNKLVEMLDATTTPEVFFFDEDMTVQYRGQVDNWYYALGKYRNHTTRHYLDEAITSFLNNELIETIRTQPVGCIIERNSVCK